MLDKRFEMKLDVDRVKRLEEMQKVISKILNRKVSIAEVIRMAIDAYSPKF